MSALDAAALTGITILVLIAWLLVKAENARRDKERTDADLGQGWRRCPGCRKPFWQNDTQHHVACKRCRGKR